MKTVDYDQECEGIIKKQMKFNFTTPFEVSDFESKLKLEKHVKCKILNQIDNPSGRVKFKDVRKVDVGYWQNDVLKLKKNPKVRFIIVLSSFSVNE